MNPSNLVTRFRGWVVAAIAIGALLTLGGSLWADLPKVQSKLATFRWPLAAPVLALTLVNYSLRFVKWHYLLRRLGVPMPLVEDAWNFTAGLAMVISPGKAGELLKPYVVRARTGTPMAETIPVLITERLTDGIAVLILAGLGVSTFAAEKASVIVVPAALTVVGLAVLASERLTGLGLQILGRLPVVGRFAGKVTVLVSALRRCCSPIPLVLTVLLSVVAWGAECLGYWLVLGGLGVDAGLDVATFLYAFATVAGGPSPGGLGMAEGVLVAMPMALIPDLSRDTAVASTILIRLATLWLGVGLGALALFRVSALLGGELNLSAREDAEGAPTDRPA